MNLLRSLLVKTLGRLLPTRSRSPLSAIYKTPSISQLSADDVYDAVIMAESGDTSRLFPLYDQIVIENSHLQTEFGKRKLALLGDPLTFSPATKDAADVAACGLVQTWHDESTDWLDAMIALLDSTLYPVAVVQKWFTPGSNGRRYDLRLRRVDPELFDFRNGQFRIFDTDAGVRMGSSHEITDEEYVIHRGHLLTSPDCWGGPMRSLLGWHLLAHASPEWWGRFLERLGAPFLVGHVSSGDDADKDKVEQAFSQALRLFGIVVSEGTRIEMLQAQSAQTGEAHEKLHDKCCREISKLILGQTSSADVQKTGSMSNSNTAHIQVKNEFRDWDDMRLCDTVTRQIIVPLLRSNGISGRPPCLSHGSSDTDLSDLNLDIIRSLPAALLELTDEGVETFSRRLGLPLQRTAKAAPPEERPAPFSAEADLILHRPQLLQSAQSRLVSATTPRLTRQLAAADLPDAILGTGADVFLQFLETSALQGN